MKTKLQIALLVVLILSTMACGSVNTLMGMGKSAGTVANLWSDVPPLEGAKKANLDIPLAARLVMQTMMKSMSQEGGSMDFIAFTTSKTPAEVQSFYTKERMAAAGWKGEEATGCTGEETGGAANLGSLCLFTKRDGAKQVGLAIIVAQDDTSKQTNVFYARFSVTGTPTPVINKP